MPLRPRSQQTPASTPNRRAARGRQKNYALVLGLALGALAAVIVAVGLMRLQDQGQVVIAAKGIAMYSQVQDASLQIIKVPASSITDGDITPEELKAQRRSGQKLVTRVEILPGQRLQESALAASSVGSFAVVKSDERVVALNTSFAGIVAGAVVPGSVVDVLSDQQDDAPVITNAKVLAVGQSSDVAQQVENARGKAVSGEQAGLVVVLAVKSDQANLLANMSDAKLAVNPQLSFNSRGNICRIQSCGASRPSSSDAVEPADTTGTSNSAVDPTAPTAADGQ